MDFSNLQSRASSGYIPPHRTQLHPRMHSFSSFASMNPKPSPQSREKWWIVSASILVAPFLFYLFVIGRGIHQSSKFNAPKAKGFGIIIDAGSIGSRIHIFEFLNEGRIPFVGFDGKGSNSLKVRPGLSEFESDPEGAGSSILSLLEFAKARIPNNEWKHTKVRLMATGRLGKITSQSRKAILESCRQTLRSSGFLFKNEWASVIAGQERGLYAWVAANYALGTLGGDPQETTGIIELGGASMQVAFSATEPPPIEFSRMIKVAGVTYNLYAQSVIYFGQDEAWESLHEFHKSRVLTSFSSLSERIVSSPCIPKGYGHESHASNSSNSRNGQHLASYMGANFSSCRSEALAYLNKRKDKCLHPPCKIVSSQLLELRGNPIPPENFYYISELFGLFPKASLSELEVAGQHYCEDSWDKLKDEHHGIDEEDLLRYCFSSAYILALLHDSLGIPMDDNRIGFANQAGSTPLDWTLGAFILQTVTEPFESEPDDLGQIVGNNSVTYVSIFAILLFTVFAAFFVSKGRKPHLKTIYDLEKGHYIVTRVPR